MRQEGGHHEVSEPLDGEWFLMLLKVHQGQDSVVGFIALTVQYIVNTRIVRNLSMPAPTKPLA